MARYKANQSIPDALSEQWDARDIQNIQRIDPDLSQDDARDRLEKIHSFAKDQFRDANRKIGSMLAGNGIFVEHDDTAQRLEKIERELAKPKPKPDSDRER